MKQICLYLFIVLFFVGCKKEDIYDECDSLSELFQPTGITNGQTYTKMDSMQFVYGSINPNNSDEVVYYGGKHPNWHMYVYNLVTKQRTKISDHSPTHNIKWHKSGWICYAGTDNNVYIVKANGDSLTQLTTTGNCFYPEWNSTGNKIICYRGYQYFADGNNYLIDVEAQSAYPIKVVDGPIGICSWSYADSLILEAPWKEVLIRNVNTDNVEVVALGETLHESINGICWMPNGISTLWCPNYKPEILNVETGITEKLLGDCEKLNYSYPSVTLDGRYALFNLNIGGYVGYNTTQTKHRLSRIDLTTNTETILDLPE